MSDLDNETGKIIIFAVFGDNKKLAQKIIDKSHGLDTHDFCLGVANAISQIKCGLDEIDEGVSRELEILCEGYQRHECDICRENAK